MKVATIVPIPHLSETREDEYFLALAQHMHVPEYRKFFQDRLTEGRFVILDNGAAEEGAINPETLWSLTNDLQPTEVILPDVVCRRRKTLKAGREFIDTLERRGHPGSVVRRMAVPQGEDLEDWTRCLREMLTWRIHTIGISKFVCLFTTRSDALKRAMDLLHHEDIHLLGCGWDPRDVQAIEREWPGRVRGVDSGIATICSQQGISMSGIGERCHAPLDFHARTDPALLGKNIFAWKAIVAGHG